MEEGLVISADGFFVDTGILVSIDHSMNLGSYLRAGSDAFFINVSYADSLLGAYAIQQFTFSIGGSW